MHTYAIDFETFYSKDVSINEQGIYGYLRHPEQDIYLVSISGTDGTRFTGHPKDAPWATICAGEPTWLSHNTGFDLPVFMRLQELGHAPEYLRLKDWHDTADLAAFLGYPRSLKEAAFHLLGIPVNKDTRDKMKGKRWDDMDPAFKEEVVAYAQADADNCLKLWLEHGHKWPQHERDISKMTREMAYLGIPLCRKTLEEAKGTLSTAVWEAEAKIPWAGEHPVLSPLAIRAECLKVGIEAPESFAEKDEDAQAWEEKYSDTYPWIKAIRGYRKAGKHLKTVETMLGRLREEGPYAGTLAYGLKYFGAATGRDSGDSGINIQNFPKGTVSGVDIRSCIKAPEGETFLIIDLSQIEPRVIHWLAGDEKTLQFIREVPDLYEAFARSWALYSDPRPLKDVDQKLRHTTKTMALGCQYLMGAKKFSEVAGFPLPEAERLVSLYRSKNAPILNLGRRLESTLRKTAQSPTEKHAEVELPSGRSLIYRNVSTDNGGLTAEVPRNGKMQRLGVWTGHLLENLTQAVARDCFMDRCVALYNLNLKPVMRVHDEVVISVPESRAEELFQLALKTMTTPPEWAVGLPLAADGCISKVYKK